jgi:multidrug efflux system outer membrane protein
MIEMDRRKGVFVIGFLSVLCSGCAVGPNYKKPEVPVPPAYRGVSAEQAAKAEAASFGDEKWWDAFQDETLRSLIQTALKQNYDVQIAATRILQARAQLGRGLAVPLSIPARAG